MHIPELLAPAGSFEALRAACWAGADAVYLGGKNFSARASAANFDNEQLAQAILFAHRSNVKVYVTVNTLLKQSEVEAAVAFLCELHNMGADAVIIQDLGLLRLAAEHVPRLERHASTQTTTTSLWGVAALKELGAHRVVLARELEAVEVREIVSANILPVELFIHGALCVAYSGQCLLSSIIGGRSGNRGQCAQPCRLPFSGPVKYPLSPRDLCLIEHVPELLTLGASSWKIEGRLKRPEYVAEVVSIYRKAIERAILGGEYSVSDTDKTRLLQAFNRDFTIGYFHGPPKGDFYSGTRPDNRGVAVGVVSSATGSAFRVRFSTPVGEGDICDLGFQDSSFTISERAAANEELEFQTDGKVQVQLGAVVSRIIDAQRYRELAQSIERYEPQATEVDFEVSGAVGEPIYLRACAGGSCAEIIGSNVLEASRSADNSRGMIDRQLQKLGGTAFVARDIQVFLGPNTFIAVGDINASRREVINELTEKLWGQTDKMPMPSLFMQVGKHKRNSNIPLLGVSVADLEEARAAEAAGADYIIYGREWLDVSAESAWRQFEAIWNNSSKDAILRFPRIMHTTDERNWRLIRPEGMSMMVSSPGAARLAQEFTNNIYGDTGLNIMNSSSIRAIKGLRAVALSHELNRSEIIDLAERSELDIEVVVHGRQLLMVHANCTWSPHCRGKDACRQSDVRVDRKGAEFPIATDYGCRSYVLNSQVLSLIDAIPTLTRAGVSRLRIEAAGASPSLVHKTVSLYRQALSIQSDRERIVVLRGNLAQEWGILTRGHWQRGV
ncbi:MAG: collagenase-like protease [Bacillota bacterium]|nr:MAG: collagenase-like protease [Bacillota bacterium]